MNKKMDTSNLEQISAQIDVWIDEEEYCQVQAQFNKVGNLKRLFEPTYCTHNEDADKNWHGALTSDKPQPVTLKDGSIIDKDWSRLFYAKLLRSKIQEKGTDCYFNRLDQVVAYLEKYIPDHYNNVENVESVKLAVLYQLELSTASLSYEMMGYAERARRLLQEIKNTKEKDIDYFCWFYELLARYNIGVAHFHISNNSKAIS
ncbi:MAG: hypothetical protein D4R38_00005, partial [Dehalococcoidia bacterium]